MAILSQFDQDEVDKLAHQFAKEKKLGNWTSRAENQIIEKLKFLVLNRVSRYKSFSNYEDLKQEGLEALLMALRTFNGRAPFTWWADQYIALKVSRSANNHSVFKIPIKETRVNKPIKVDKFPIIEDLNINLDRNIKQKNITEALSNYFQHLTTDEKNVLNLFYGLNGIKQYTIKQIGDEMLLTKSQTTRVLKQARKKIKELAKHDNLHEKI